MSNAFEDYFGKTDQPTPPNNSQISARSLAIEALVRAAFIDLNVRGYVSNNTVLQDEIAGPAAFRMAGYAALGLSELGEGNEIIEYSEDKIEDGFEFDRFILAQSEVDARYAVTFKELYQILLLCISNSYMLHRYVSSVIKEE